MTPEEHDRALAVTSHLPHMAAAALANTVTENYFRLAGTGRWTRPGWRRRYEPLEAILMQTAKTCYGMEQYHAQLQACTRRFAAATKPPWTILKTAKRNRDALGS